MLIPCPECELQVSDKAISCPHCGYPLKPKQISRTQSRSNKRRRLPNGFGQISEIKNKNLRKPFRAMVTVGKNKYGKPISKLLQPDAYFETYNDAYMALVEYNRNPYDIKPEATVQETYEKWSESYFKTLTSQSSINTINNAWSYCSEIYDMKMCDVRARHIKACIENGTSLKRGKLKKATSTTQDRIKSVFNLLFDYAVEYDLTDKNYSRIFTLSKEVYEDIEKNKRDHIPYTSEEMDILWSNIDFHPLVDLILIQCYSGWRPGELLDMKLSDIDLENWTMTGGSKTESGKNRIVPIHTKIRPLVKSRFENSMKLGSDRFVNKVTRTNTIELTSLNYSLFGRHFDKICKGLNINEKHRPHDGRIHFTTEAKKSGVDEYVLKRILGHKISDVTENIYTKRDVEWIAQELEKIK